MACTRAHAWRCERCKRRRATALAARAPQSLPRTFREPSQRRPTTAPPLLPNTFLPPSYHLPSIFLPPSTILRRRARTPTRSTWTATAASRSRSPPPPRGDDPRLSVVAAGQWGAHWVPTGCPLGTLGAGRGGGHRARHGRRTQTAGCRTRGRHSSDAGESKRWRPPPDTPGHVPARVALLTRGGVKTRRETLLSHTPAPDASCRAPSPPVLTRLVTRPLAPVSGVVPAAGLEADGLQGGALCAAAPGLCRRRGGRPGLCAAVALAAPMH